MTLRHDKTFQVVPVVPTKNNPKFGNYSSRGLPNHPLSAIWLIKTLALHVLIVILTMELASVALLLCSIFVKLIEGLSNRPEFQLASEFAEAKSCPYLSVSGSNIDLARELAINPAVSVPVLLDIHTTEDVNTEMYIGNKGRASWYC